MAVNVSRVEGVDVAAIERELVRLLHEPGNVSSGGLPGARTAVVNLVAYAADRPTLAHIVETVGALTERHPSRTIAVRVDPAVREPPIDAWVQVQCQSIGTSGLNACNDLIVIEASPSAARRVPNVILPLLLADLPEVFWWPGEPPLREPLLYDLLQPARRFVVNTAGFVHVERTLINLDALRRRPGLTLDLSDLNWGRLLPWRELIAQFWDVRAWRTDLSRVELVEIELGRPAGGRSNRAQGLLLAGWLASRLGWTPLSTERMRDGYRLNARRRRSPVEIRIRIVAAAASGLRAVQFARSSRGGVSRYEIRATEADCAVMAISSDGRRDVYERVCRLETLSLSELLARELDMSQRETIFEDALESAAAFLTAAGAPS